MPHVLRTMCQSADGSRCPSGAPLLRCFASSSASQFVRRMQPCEADLLILSGRAAKPAAGNASSNVSHIHINFRQKGRSILDSFLKAQRGRNSAVPKGRFSIALPVVRIEQKYAERLIGIVASALRNCGGPQGGPDGVETRITGAAGPSRSRTPPRAGLA
jgi:hypothetical protein